MTETIPAEADGSAADGPSRIRWQETSRGGLTGYVGTLESQVFHVWRDHLRDCGKDWVLTAYLPDGMAVQRPGDSPDELKAEAESWLEEFVSSLGASFDPEQAQERV